MREKSRLARRLIHLAAPKTDLMKPKQINDFFDRGFKLIYISSRLEKTSGLLQNTLNRPEKPFNHASHLAMIL